MKCLRCGHCCLTYAIVAVDDPNKPLNESNVLLLDGTTRCPHLTGDKAGEYGCDIHHHTWFKDTPCGQFTQIEAKDCPCRLGTYIIAKEK